MISAIGVKPRWELDNSLGYAYLIGTAGEGGEKRALPTRSGSKFQTFYQTAFDGFGLGSDGAVTICTIQRRGEGFGCIIVKMPCVRVRLLSMAVFKYLMVVKWSFVTS